MKAEYKYMIGAAISAIPSLYINIAGAFSGMRLDSAASSMAHPITNFLAFHTGDGAPAFDFYTGTYLLSYIPFRKMSERKRIALSAAITSIPLVVLETINFPHHIFGYADFMDIPFGLFAIASAASFLSSMKYAMKDIW